jgi:hypothetical protein
MMDAGAVFDLVLSIALAAFLAVQLKSKKETRPTIALWIGFVLLFVLTSRGASWLAPRLVLPVNELPPRLPLSQTWANWRFEIALGFLSFACFRRGWQAAILGAVCGLFFASLGYSAYRWLCIGQAWKLMGSFAGQLLLWFLPLKLAASCGIVSFALLDEDARPFRWHLAFGIVFLWYSTAMFCQWRLESAWDFGPRSLAQAAGLAPVEEAPTVAMAWLKPLGIEPYRVEEKQARLDGMTLSQSSLVRLYEYLDDHHYHTLFLKEGLKTLRKGWIFWWDPDRALKAATLNSPGLVFPDYRGALGLIQAGPQTRSRYAILQGLSERAKPRREGFEDVTQSQYIFEGFSGAYARFGDEDQARWWLMKIDNLWPVYEKKIEVTPIENVHDGEVDGSVFFSSVPALGIHVGLFYLGTSTTTEAAISSGTLSDSVLADADGRFRFMYLGPGRYYLGLQAPPEELRGRIHDSPGLFWIKPEEPVARLGPIIIDP